MLNNYLIHYNKMQRYKQNTKKRTATAIIAGLLCFFSTLHKKYGNKKVHRLCVIYIFHYLRKLKGLDFV